MKMYNAAVEVAKKSPSAEEFADELMDALASYSVAVGTSPRGWLEVRISLPAVSLAQAVSTALAVVESAVGVGAIACEVMDEEEFAAREGFEVVPDLLGVSEVAELLGVSRQRVDQLVHAGKIQAVPVGARARGYTRSSVEALAAQERTGGRPPAKV